jgi:toxin ParE1/3/4
MPHYKFTADAQRDLEEIIQNTVEHWGAQQAHQYLDGLETLAARLAETGQLGTQRNDLAEGLRSFPYVSHVLYYVIEPHGITLVRVLHKHYGCGTPPQRRQSTQKVNTSFDSVH